MIPIIQNNNIMLRVTCYVLRESRGYALLLAILVTSVVLAGATAFASIVISEIRQTREIGDAIAARAVAESDIEQSLFVLRRGGEDVLESVSAPIGVHREIEHVSPTRPFIIAENDFVSLPVPFNFAGNNIIIPAWETATGCAGSWIEVSTISWNGESGFSPYRHPYSRSEAETTSLSIPISANTVELRIRALYCDITALRVNNLPSRIKIASTAEVQGASQTAEVIVSRTIPTAGLFDFVIFSECSIIKGGGSPVFPVCP